MYYNLLMNTSPTTSLEQILRFINHYYYEWEISYNNRLNFTDIIEFRGDDYMNLFIALLHIHLESAIDLEIKWQESNELWKINNELKKHLKKYKTSNKWSFLSKFIWEEEWYSILSILLNWDSIKKDINHWDLISFNITINPNAFFTLLFSKITEELWYKQINREKSSKDLYKFIIDLTWWKVNHYDNIEIFYSFNDFLDNKRLTLPILAELENKWLAKIKNIRLKDNYIYFIIDKITWINEEIIIDIWNRISDTTNPNLKYKVENIAYTDDWIMINWKKWIPKNSEKSEYFLKLLSLYFSKNPNINNISITKFNDFYIQHNKENLKYLTLTEKNIENSYIKTINKKFREEYIEDLLQISRWDIIRLK